MKSNKVTKKQLLQVLFCDGEGERYKILIDNHWPWWRWKVSVAEILIEARRMGVGDVDIWWILHNLDYENCPGLSKYNLTSRDVVDEYLAGGDR